MSAQRNEVERSAKANLLAFGSFAGGTPALPADALSADALPDVNDDECQ